MTRASPRLTSVTAALAVALFAAAPAAASPVFLSLDRPSNQLAAISAAQEIPVSNFFWSPADPPPIWDGIHSYLMMHGAAWDAGSPVDNGALGALVRRGSCRPMARYQGARLRIGNHVHRLRDVVVTGCSALPVEYGGVEWMALAFAKVE